MSTIRGRVRGAKKRAIVGMMLAVLFAGTASAEKGGDLMQAPEGKQTVAKQNNFSCNLNALSAAERAQHKQLGDKLISVRKAIVETEKGYEFQYSPKDVSLAELADWVRAEAKCCPFFDFHIDVEKEATLLCLRLTGEEGIKPFIRAEFQVAGK